MGLKTEVDLLYNALLNGPAVTLTRYPIGAVGMALTGSGMTTGAYDYAAAGANQAAVTGLLAAANTTGWWVAGGHLQNPSVAVDEDMVLRILRGTIPDGTVVCDLQWTAWEVTAVGQLSFPTVYLSLPIFVSVGVGLAMDLANSTNVDMTANCSVFVYAGLGA